MLTLPLDVADFTGRRAELARLLAQPGPAQGVAIHAVDGMAGVGKTALVRRAAHLLASRFPDGQLFVDLHAHTPGQTPAGPAAVLAWLLDKTGLDPRHIPADLDGRAARWRDRIAGRKVLLVLDDAATSAQVQPLLPGSGQCLVLITSRHRLVDLEGAVPLPLETLPPDQAKLLFLRVSHRTAEPGDDDALTQIVGLCGYLPLAITLLARRLIHRNTWSIAHLASGFAAAADRLSDLTGGDRSGDLAVATAFDMSYHDLPPGQQRLFHRLGLHPGPGIDAYAAAALGNIPIDRARRGLDAMYFNHLLDETMPGRYRLHDLLRAYARTLASHDLAADQVAALDRLMGYYHHTARTADRYLAQYTRPELPPATRHPPAHPELPSRAAALAWMRTERANLLACINHATAYALDSHTTALTATLTGFLHLDGPWLQAVGLHQAAATAARHNNDRLGEANALTDLGRINRLTGAYPTATGLLEQAREIYTRSGDRLGEANALTDLGRINRLTGAYPTATGLLEQAREIYTRYGDRLGEANALTDLGRINRLTGAYPTATGLLEQAREIYTHLGDRLGEANTFHELGIVRCLTGEYPAAAGLLEQAREIYTRLGDCLGEAHAFHDLGRVHHLTGDYPAAAELLEQAQVICQQLGDRLGEAHACHELGTICCLTGEYPAAAGLLEQAREIYAQLGNPLSEASALHDLGRVHRLTGDYPAAAELLEQAQGICQQLRSRLGKANVLHDLGIIRHLTGDYPAAAEQLERALLLFREMDDRQGEAETLNSMGAFIADSASPYQALPLYEQALRIASQIHSPLDKAHALEGIACCTARTGDPRTAITPLRAAVAIYQRLNTPEAATAATYLATLESRV
jgi:tetratricopeptide (TPR) repeat protein